MWAQTTGEPHWTVEAHLLDDLRMVQTGTAKKPAKPHPQRPTPAKRQRQSRDTPEFQRHLAAARRRARERQRRIDAGEL